ncbi:MAG: carbohydrate binding domain-containing protein [Bacillota bacterium]
MLKKTVILLFVFAMLLSVSAFTAGAADNLLLNGGFEEGDTAQPSNWTREFWQQGAVLSLTDQKSYRGKYSLMLKSDNPNDVRMVQTVKVKPNTCYKLSGWVSYENVTSGKVGANLCVVMNGFNHSPTLNGTGDWTYTELNFRTHARQTMAVIGARLGMWGNDVTGTAYFDELSLTELDFQPPDCQQLLDEKGTSGSKKGSFGAGGLWLIILLVAVAAVVFYRKKMKPTARG